MRLDEAAPYHLQPRQAPTADRHLRAEYLRAGGQHRPLWCSLPGPARRTQDATGQNVYVQFQLGLFVALDDGAPVVQTLEILKLKVAGTLDAFKPDFQ